MRGLSWALGAWGLVLVVGAGGQAAAQPRPVERAEPEAAPRLQATADTESPALKVSSSRQFAAFAPIFLGRLGTPATSRELTSGDLPIQAILDTCGFVDPVLAGQAIHLNQLSDVKALFQPGRLSEIQVPPCVKLEDRTVQVQSDQTVASIFSDAGLALNSRILTQPSTPAKPTDYYFDLLEKYSDSVQYFSRDAKDLSQIPIKDLPLSKLRLYEADINARLFLMANGGIRDLKKIGIGSDITLPAAKPQTTYFYQTSGPFWPEDLAQYVDEARSVKNAYDSIYPSIDARLGLRPANLPTNAPDQTDLELKPQNFRSASSDQPVPGTSCTPAAPLRLADFLNAEAANAAARTGSSSDPGTIEVVAFEPLSGLASRMAGELPDFERVDGSRYIQVENTGSVVRTAVGTPDAMPDATPVEEPPTDSANAIGPQSTDADVHHSVAIADLLLGGVDLQAYRYLNDLKIRLHLVNVFAWSSDNKFDPQADFKNFFLDRVKGSAASKRWFQRVSVFNFSMIQNEEDRNFLKNIIEEMGISQIVIAAAGNRAKDETEAATTSLDERRFPASYGGNGRSPGSATVITVGTATPEGARADFSLFSGDRVDLLAPGCGIYVTMPSSETDPFADADSQTVPHVRRIQSSGTSYSTAIVSFLAARLIQEGLTPEAIKERAAIGVDYNPKLEGQVRSAGYLDVAKFLAANVDVVEARAPDGSSTTLRYGVIQDQFRNAPLEMCRGVRNPLPTLSEALKITRVVGNSDGGLKFRVVLLNSNSRGSPTSIFCTPTEEELNEVLIDMKDTAKKRTFRFALKDIEDFVQRTRKE